MTTVPTSTSRLPVAVIGAGPIGLAAATHLLERGLVPVILEAGDQPGASVAEWRHVRLFTPWCLALDQAALRLLTNTGWPPLDPDWLPTGHDLLERYLLPLAATPELAPHLRLGHAVTGIARLGLDKVRSPGREHLPFVVRVRSRDGGEHDLEASAVIDAAGTWTQPNPLGANGLPALGERTAIAGGNVVTGLPDILRRHQPARPRATATPRPRDPDRLGGPLRDTPPAGRQGQRPSRRAARQRSARHRPARPHRWRPGRAGDQLPHPSRTTRWRGCDRRR